MLQRPSYIDKQVFMTNGTERRCDDAGCQHKKDAMAWLWQHVTQQEDMMDVVLIQEPCITGTNVVAGMPSG